MFELEPSWREVLKDELKKPYVAKLLAFVQRERRFNGPVYPPEELVFNALWHTPFDKTSVVIVGQDPYHAPGQAHGLCFSVPKGIAIPPSLKNIYKEISDDLALPTPSHGCLTSWADQGVLLLNTLLTVKEKSPMSHQKQGWEEFTNAVITALGQRKQPLVALLWGSAAQKKWHALNSDINTEKQLVLKAAHPSPLSAYAGFFGCRHFSQTNQFLEKNGLPSIKWC